jgi:hypothetical protein
MTENLVPILAVCFFVIVCLVWRFFEEKGANEFLRKENKSLKRKILEEKMARDWASSLKDLESAKDELWEEERADEEREMEAWVSFKESWKSSWIQRYNIKQDSIMAASENELARRAFWGWYGERSQKSMLAAKRLALLEEDRRRVGG